MLVALLAGAVVFWWERRIEARANPATRLLAASDDYLYYYPTFHYAFAQLRTGHIPF